jgi:hypothetical protein
MQLAAEYNVSADLVASYMIGLVMSSTFGNVVCEVRKNHEIPSVLWIAVGACSGSGKTPVLSRLQKPLHTAFEAALSLSQEDVSRINAQLKALQARKKTLLKELERANGESDHTQEELAKVFLDLSKLRLPVLPVSSSVTPYVLAQELEKSGGYLASISSEGGILATLLCVPNEYLSPLMDAWSVQHISVVKKGVRIDVPRPRFSACVSWQPENARRILFTEKRAYTGLTARFLYCEVPRMAPSYIFCVADHVLDAWWEGLVSSLVERYVKDNENMPRKMCLDVQALEALRAFCASLTGALSNVRGMSEFSAKIMDHVVRLAMALHCLDEDHMSSDVIGHDQVMRACGLVVYFVQQHERCWGLEYERDVREVARKVGGYFAQISVPHQAFPWVSVDDVATYAGITMKQARQAMQWLAARNWVEHYHLQDVNNNGAEYWRARVYFGGVDYEC